MYQGYVKLWRKIQDSKIWTQEKFTRGQAWIDLIMLANHKEGYIRKRGIRINLGRGDIGWSERELSKRWKWSRDKVRRFLTELCSDNEQKLRQQTIPQNKNITSCYSIINYDTYQDNKTTDNTTNRPQTDRKQDQNKNVKNVKNEKNNGIAEDVYAIYIDLVSPLYKSRQRALKNIDRHLKKHTKENLILSAQNYSTIAKENEPRYRKDPANFFGVTEPSFMDYLSETFIPPKTPRIPHYI